MIGRTLMGKFGLHRSHHHGNLNRILSCKWLLPLTGRKRLEDEANLAGGKERGGSVLGEWGWESLGYLPQPLRDAFSLPPLWKILVGYGATDVCV